MKNFFVVLGGMGTMATESFVHLLNHYTPAHDDQSYLNYIVMNHATVPDRTVYILGESDESPLQPLLEDVQMMSTLQPDFFVLTCNTAHYFYPQLQEATTIPIFHMPKLAVSRIQVNETRDTRVMILATTGTIQTDLYSSLIRDVDGLIPVIPDDALQQEVMRLIYDDIKMNNHMNWDRYHAILEKAVTTYQCDAIILGCTELSLMQMHAPEHDYPVIDAQFELVRAILNHYDPTLVLP